MISLDTHVLVRVLVGDDPDQTRIARALLDKLERRGETAHVSEVVLCELVWVLGSGYGHARARLAPVLRQVVAAKQLTFDAPENILRALAAFEAGRGDFADYLIREHAQAAGCAAVVTFDRKLLKERMFVAP